MRLLLKIFFLLSQLLPYQWMMYVFFVLCNTPIGSSYGLRSSAESISAPQTVWRLPFWAKPYGSSTSVLSLGQVSMGNGTVNSIAPISFQACRPGKTNLISQAGNFLERGLRWVVGVLALPWRQPRGRLSGWRPREMALKAGKHPVFFRRHDLV